MTAKSIIEVDVNAAAFQRYQQLFAKYQEQLSKQPSLWQKINKGVVETSNTASRMAAAIKAQVQTQREMDDVYKSQNQSLRQGDRLWGSMASHAKSIAGSILSATRSLITWSGVVGAVGGLLGAGSLFGIDRMARSVSGDRRSAMGLGLSIGEQKAFDVNFGSRLVDSGSFLGWVNQMEMDPRKAASASALGVGLTQRTGADSVAMLRAIRSRALAMDPRQRGMLPGMLGLDGVSGEDVRRLASMSSREFEGLASGYGRDVGKLNIGDSTAEKWADFIRRLDEAKGAIFKTLVQGLVPLEKPLEHLSGAFEKFVQTLLKSDMVKHAIEGLADYLEKFSGQIGSPAFLDSVKRFTSDVGDLADAVHAVTYAVSHPGATAAKAQDNMVSYLGSKFMQVFRPDEYYKYAGSDEVGKFLSRIDDQNSLPEGTMARIWQQESGSSFNPRDSKKGAIGPFQFMPKTASSVGVDPHSFSDSASGAGYYLNQLRARYHGDLKQALAAYNWGPGNMDEYLKTGHGLPTKAYPGGAPMPDETRNYVSGVGGGVRVEIFNNTGGAAHVVASQLAH